MMAVGDSIEFIGGVTLHADTVSGRAQSGAMRLVAIAAGHARGEHRTLLERLIIVGLLNIAGLTVGVKDPALEWRHPMRIG